MDTLSYKKIKFLNKDKSLFFSVLRSNIDNYFQENNLPKTGEKTILFKAIFMLSLYFIPYFLLYSGYFSGWQLLGLCVVMGFGVAGVGMSVMHDAIHGSFSKNGTINQIFGASIYLLGGNAYNWDVQHNKLHHTYTNIHEIDEDITGKFLLRLSSSAEHKSVHRFQYIYAFFLYSLMTVSFFWKDFKEIKLYNKMAASGLVKAFPKKELYILLAGKIAYIIFIFVLPYYFLPITFGQWAAGFFLMHGIAGVILSTIFQLAHIVEGANHYEQESGTIENAWAIHQLDTTANFAGNNKILSWYIGGLDYQIEHHLFPNISHIHYPKISEIVKKTAEDFGIRYNNKGSFTNGLLSHIAMLKELGRA
jgi:linoleoyl-CoA desaturase